MNLIYFLLKSGWEKVLLATVMGFVSGISSAGLVALSSRALGANSASSLTTLAWGFGGLALVTLVTSIATRVLLIRLSQAAVFQLRMDLCRQILDAELIHLEKLGTAPLLATLTEDVQAIANGVYVLPFLCINMAIVAGCLGYVTWLSWQVLILVMVLSILAVGSTRFLLKKGRKLLVFAREEQDNLFQNFRSLTAGIKELKLNGDRREYFLRSELQTTAFKLRDYNVRGLTLFASTDSSGKLIFFFAIGLVLFVLPNFITISRQNLTAYVLTFTYIIGPMENIVNKLPILTKANVALQKIDSVGLSLVSHLEKSSEKQEGIKIATEEVLIELKGVTHTYHYEQEDKPFTLGEIDLVLPPGETIFVIGGNGSGKSTLAKLITGLYVPETGNIFLNGKQIKRENRDWYRQHFAVVFSDFYLFASLLGLNATYLDTQAKAYLQKLQLTGKVKIEKGKFSTTNLSQGQRKRLALLIAYLENRPVYLFDEWAADQDPNFKAIFYHQLLPELKQRGKTVIVISHDDQYFQVADRVVKLDYGKQVSC